MLVPRAKQNNGTLQQNAGGDRNLGAGRRPPPGRRGHAIVPAQHDGHQHHGARNPGCDALGRETCEVLGQPCLHHQGQHHHGNGST